MQSNPLSTRAAIVGAAIAFAWGCARQDSDGTIDFNLQELGRYGWESPADSTRELTDEERTYNGAVLANVLDIAEDTQGRIYVLDAGFRKIVVFDREGRLDGILLGGSGEGPGEFQRPRSLALDGNGNLLVLDPVGDRIIKFSELGEVLSTINIRGSGALDIAESEGRIYVSRTAQAGQPSVLVLDSLGNSIAELLPPSGDDIKLSGVRATSALGPARDGSLLVAHAAVGSWTGIRDGRIGGMSGAPLFPDLQPILVKGPTGVDQLSKLVYLWAIGQWPDGRTALFYAFSPVAPADRANRRFLAVFDTAGRYSGSVEVPADRGTFALSRRQSEFLVVQSEPFPQVVRYRLLDSSQR